MTWEAGLLRARKTGGFAPVDKRLVGEWPTCAIGERFNVRKRGLAAAGVDAHAETLGIEFLHAVKADEIYRAVELYDQIQASKRI
jgi:hypothetical protein